MDSSKAARTDARHGTALADAAEAFLLAKGLEGAAPRTVETYGRQVRRFAGWVGDRPLSRLLVQQFFAHLQSLRRPDGGRRLGECAVHQAFRSVKCFLRWCAAAEPPLLAQDYIGRFRLRTPARWPHVPTEDDVRALVRACGTDLLGLRDLATVRVLGDAGLRVTESCALTLEDVDWGRRTMRVLGKGGKHRTVAFGPGTARALRAYIDARGRVAPEDFLFATAGGGPMRRFYVAGRLRALSARAGLGRAATPHSLRRFAATSWLRRGMGLDQVRRLLGHATLSTSLLYAALTSDDLVDAHRKAHALDDALAGG